MDPEPDVKTPPVDPLVVVCWLAGTELAIDAAADAVSVEGKLLLDTADEVGSRPGEMTVLVFPTDDRETLFVTEDNEGDTVPTEDTLDGLGSTEVCEEPMDVTSDVMDELEVEEAEATGFVEDLFPEGAMTVPLEVEYDVDPSLDWLSD